MGIKMHELFNIALPHHATVTRLIEKAEEMRATIVVLSSGFEPGERLIALGGIAALLRYRLVR
jgi:protein pelota